MPTAVVDEVGESHFLAGRDRTSSDDLDRVAPVRFPRVRLAAVVQVAVRGAPEHDFPVRVAAVLDALASILADRRVLGHLADDVDSPDSLASGELPRRDDARTLNCGFLDLYVCDLYVCQTAGLSRSVDHATRYATLRDARAPAAVPFTVGSYEPGVDERDTPEWPSRSRRRDRPAANLYAVPRALRASRRACRNGSGVRASPPAPSTSPTAVSGSMRQPACTASGRALRRMRSQ